jgi:hypothetical protein
METCTYNDHSDRESAKLIRRKQAFLAIMEGLNNFGGVATVEEVAALLNVTPTSVVGQVNSGRLIGIVDRSHQSYSIPLFQFDVSTKLQHLEAILRAMGDVSAVAACTWFLNPVQVNESTYQLPCVMLKAGVTEDELELLLRDACFYGKATTN